MFVSTVLFLSLSLSLIYEA
jgi:hypothetical protein